MRFGNFPITLPSVAVECENRLSNKNESLRLGSSDIICTAGTYTNIAVRIGKHTWHKYTSKTFCRLLYVHCFSQACRAHNFDKVVNDRSHLSKWSCSFSNFRKLWTQLQHGCPKHGFVFTGNSCGRILLLDEYCTVFRWWIYRVIYSTIFLSSTGLVTL